MDHASFFSEATLVKIGVILCLCFARLKRETSFNSLVTSFKEKMFVSVYSLFSLPMLAFLIFSPPLYNFHLFLPTKLVSVVIYFSLTDYTDYPKLILHWYACGADGRSLVPCTVTCLPNFLRWVDYHISLAVELR